MMNFWMYVPPTDLNYPVEFLLDDEFQIEHYYYVVGFDKMDYSLLKRTFGFSYGIGLGSIKIDMELLSRGYRIKIINRV